MSAFSQEIELQTSRVVMRRATVSHIDTMLDYQLRNRRHLEKWEPFRSSDFFSHDALSIRLKANEELFHAGNALSIILFDRLTEQMIGECNFTNIVRGPFQACHLGFSLDENKQGQGIMYESLTGLIEHVFIVTKLHRIMANYMPKNSRSGLLLEKLGFQVEGTARSYLKICGKWEDHVLTSLISRHDIE